MFIGLLVANGALAAVICAIAVFLFRAPLGGLLQRRFSADGARTAWRSCVALIFVAGLGIGTRYWDIQQYASPAGEAALTSNQFALELYKTGIATLLVVAVAFVVMLVAVWAASAASKKG